MQPQPAPTPLPLMAGPQAQLSWKSWKPWAGVALLAWAGLLQVRSPSAPPPLAAACSPRRLVAGALAHWLLTPVAALPIARTVGHVPAQARPAVQREVP